jgi:hypothetical protein
MPRGIVDDAAMWPRTLQSFWVSSWITLPDIWLGRLSRPGPMCFCHGYRRFLTFDRQIVTATRIDVVVTEDPDERSARCSAVRTEEESVAVRCSFSTSRDVDDIAFGVDAHFLLETAHPADFDGVPELIELRLVRGTDGFTTSFL